ncbi:putative adenylate cyclase-associated CAP [Helianthus anomalus]
MFCYEWDFTGPKPDAGGMAEFLKPLNEKLTEAHMKAGSHSGFSNHLKSTAESLTALAWIAYTGKNCGMSMPIGHVEECWQSAEFYSNKVLVEYKNKDSNHVEWAKALKELYVPGLRDYVKSHYPLGPVWSATGVTVTVPSKSSKPGAPAAPNPPPSSLASSSSSSSSSSSKQGMAAVFQEISSKPVTAGTFPFIFFLTGQNRFRLKHVMFFKYGSNRTGLTQKHVILCIYIF